MPERLTRQAQPIGEAPAAASTFPAPGTLGKEQLFVAEAVPACFEGPHATAVERLRGFVETPTAEQALATWPARAATQAA